MRKIEQLKPNQFDENKNDVKMKKKKHLIFGLQSFFLHISVVIVMIIEQYFANLNYDDNKNRSTGSAYKMF